MKFQKTIRKFAADLVLYCKFMLSKKSNFNKSLFLYEKEMDNSVRLVTTDHVCICSAKNNNTYKRTITK